MDGFLDRLAEEIIAHPAPHTLTILVPNRRPAFFLEEKLARKAGRPVLSPAIFAITDFFSEVTGLTAAPRHELLLYLYEAYTGVLGENGMDIQSFEQFLAWGGTLLNDFDELDKFLVDPRSLLTYLSEIKQAENWSPGEDQPAGEMQNYLRFFELLPAIYERFNRLLSQEGLAYDGQIYRRAYEQYDQWHKKTEPDSILIAGFNALSEAEKQIFLRLQRDGKARMYWDADVCYDEEPFEAGKFLRQYEKLFSGKEEYKWKFDACKPEKQFHVVHAPDDLAQIQFAVNRLVQWERENREQSNEKRLKTVVVLNDASLFYPILHALPPELKEINITFSLPVTYSRIFKLTDDILKFYTHLTDNQNASLEYLERIWKHPHFPGDRKAWEKWNELTGQYPASYMNKAYFFDLIKQAGLENDIPHITSTGEILTYLKQLIRRIIPSLPSDDPEKAAAVELDKLLDRMTAIQERLSQINQATAPSEQGANAEMFFSSLKDMAGFYRKLAKEVALPFQGLPLQGYQLMGLLETRLLDFDRVILLGMNEGMVPSHKKHQSFIPQDIRREAGLPLHYDHNAITAYHIYRLISRAKEVWMAYNTSTQGISSGEPSRYILQLQHILPDKKIPVNDLYLRDDIHIAPEKDLPKDDTFIERMKTLLTRRGIAPTTITAYWHYPERFFRDYWLQWDDKDEREDYISTHRLGTVIHNAMHQLYEGLIDKILKPEDISRLIRQAPETVEKIFYEEYFHLNEKPENFQLKGKNLIALEAAKEIVKKMLRIDQTLAGKSELVIKALENKIETVMEIPGIGPVKFKGTVDRIDMVDGQYRIVDYKTGSPKNMRKSPIPDPWEMKNKWVKHDQQYLFQLYFYSWLVWRENQLGGEPSALRMAIYSPQSRSAKEHAIENDFSGLMDIFEDFLKDIMWDMVDPEKPFSWESNVPETETN